MTTGPMQGGLEIMPLQVVGSERTQCPGGISTCATSTPCWLIRK